MKSNSKFKKSLVGEIKKDFAYEEKQEDLREKYNITDDNTQKVVVVEKSHLFVNALKVILNIIVYALACIGILTLLYPVLRSTFLSICMELLNQLKNYLPF